MSGQISKHLLNGCTFYFKRRQKKQASILKMKIIMFHFQKCFFEGTEDYGPLALKLAVESM